jgi:toxin ParE1/3/4
VAQITWTQEAQHWLEEIFEYIAQDSPDTAAGVVNGIYQRTQILLDFPESGYRYQNSERNVRILLYGHYRIAYLIKPSRDLDILGVFHGSLDISRYSL